ncbi:predicted protein [Arabidopsis lyrata subsp. lyrata]|uniref:Predicted protein n=1 Tax=Arabidopsis lyrata subsp. lyrata TaxID=81972 RepID=D7M1V8_ARALL|nr:predicted protein [Arabidopsis lyrata subsp. lyrata]
MSLQETTFTRRKPVTHLSFSNDTVSHISFSASLDLWGPPWGEKLSTADGAFMSLPTVAKPLAVNPTWPCTATFMAKIRNLLRF